MLLVALTPLVHKSLSIGVTGEVVHGAGVNIYDIHCSCKKEPFLSCPLFFYTLDVGKSEIKKTCSDFSKATPLLLLLPLLSYFGIKYFKEFEGYHEKI